MFAGAPPKPSAAEQANARLQTRATFRAFLTYAAVLNAAPFFISYITKMVRGN